MSELRSTFPPPPPTESRLRARSWEQRAAQVSRVRSTVGRTGMRGVGVETGEDDASTRIDKVRPSPLEGVSSDTLAISRRITGRVYETSSGAIDHAKAKLDTPGIRTLWGKYRSFRQVLGGNVAELMGGSGRVDFVKARAGRGYDSEKHGRISYRKGIAKAWETGVNIDQLITEAPNDRYKFYLSLDTADPAKSDQIVDFLHAVHDRATERGAAMLTKSEDHTYDSVDLYTWSPVEMADILSELYHEYPAIWSSTEHPLQGEVSGIDPSHIGFVQEPIGGLGGHAHSSRMGMLGAALDEGASFEEACKAVSVLPEAPWLIDPVAL